MPETDEFDAWLEVQLRELLPSGYRAVPPRRAPARGHRGWSRVLGWLVPPMSGKLLVATTALAVAGTAGAAATGHVTLPRVIPPPAPVVQAPAQDGPPAQGGRNGATGGGAGGTGANATQEGSDGAHEGVEPGDHPAGAAPAPGGASVTGSQPEGGTHSNEVSTPDTEPTASSPQPARSGSPEPGDFSTAAGALTSPAPAPSADH